MKVVFIIDSLRRHGAQRFLTYLVRGLSKLGHVQEVIVLNRARDSDIEEALFCGQMRRNLYRKICALVRWSWLVAIGRHY